MYRAMTSLAARRLVAFTFRKGQQIIDQMGDRMFT